MNDPIQIFQSLYSLSITNVPSAENETYKVEQKNKRETITKNVGWSECTILFVWKNHDVM